MLWFLFLISYVLKTKLTKPCFHAISWLKNDYQKPWEASQVTSQHACMFGTDLCMGWGWTMSRQKWRFQALEWPRLDPSRDLRSCVWIYSAWINPHSKRHVMCVFMLQINRLFDKQFCWSKFIHNSRMAFDCPEHTGGRNFGVGILNVIQTFLWPSCRCSGPTVCYSDCLSPHRLWKQPLARLSKASCP